MKDDRITNLLRLERTIILRPSSPTPCSSKVRSPKTGFPQPCPVRFRKSPRIENWQTFLGNLCQCLTILTVKMSFHVFRCNFLDFDLYPLPIKCTAEGEVWLPLLHPHLFTDIDKIQPSFFFCSLESSGSLSLSSSEREPSP